MVSAKITLSLPKDLPKESTEMLIVGGGICGILAAKNCHDRGIKYILFERESCLGGNWHTLANTHSYLQVNKMRLPSFFLPLSQNSAAL